MADGTADSAATVSASPSLSPEITTSLELGGSLSFLRNRLGFDVTVIGAGSRLEVWDSAVWDTYLEQTEQSFADTAEEVIPGLF